MLDPIGQIARRVKRAENSGAHLRIAKVTGAWGGKVQLDISDDAWVAVDADVAGLEVGDRVYAVQEGSVIIVTGRLGAGGTTAKDVPIGALLPYAGTSSAFPEGYLPCDGRVVSRTTYATLFARLGTTYGGGDGSTTFGLPNLTNRFPLGEGSRGRGTTGGAERVTLSTGELPSHTHNMVGAYGDTVVQSGSGATVGNHLEGPTGATGSGQSHENMPPFVVVYFLIRVL